MQTPRFNIRKEKFGPHILFKLLDTSSGEYAAIFPFLGGSLNSLVLKSNIGLIDVVDGYVSIEDIEKNLGSSFKGCSLFPFPNRIKDGAYHFAEKLHHLPINFPDEHNAIHGLVYDKKFTFTKKQCGDNECSLTIQYISPEKLQGYPFRFVMDQEYQLCRNQGFKCTTKITNISDAPIPLGHGWHPYFKAGTDFIDALSLEFPATSLLDVDHKNIPTGKTSEFHRFSQLKKIGNSHFDSCFTLDTSKVKATVILANRQKNFQLKIWQETGKNRYNFLQIYTPPCRTSIAIEPMTCAPDVFNNGNGIIVLQPSDSHSLSWGVSIDEMR